MATVKKKALTASLSPSPPPVRKIRKGKMPTGLYPGKSRSDLSQAVKPKMSISAISHILLGKRKANLTLALQLSALCGVTIQQFETDWQAQRKVLTAPKRSRTR